jgi:hypothetical protein
MKRLRAVKMKTPLAERHPKILIQLGHGQTASEGSVLVVRDTGGSMVLPSKQLHFAPGGTVFLQQAVVPTTNASVSSTRHPGLHSLPLPYQLK